MGTKEVEATNFLEKKFKGNPQMSYDDAVQAAISSLAHVLSEDLKPADIEVGVVRDDPAGERAFKVLTNEEVDHFLTLLSERD